MVGPSADDDQNHAGRSRDEPLAVDLFHVLDMNFVLRRFLNTITDLWRTIRTFVIIERERRHDDAHADLEAAAVLQLRILAVRPDPEKIADRRKDAFLLNADRRIAKARSELQRIDAVVVHDAVEVDVADVAFGRELRLHLEQRSVEERVGLAPEHRSAHFAGGRADVAREKLLVLEIDVDGLYEMLAVEKAADGDFHAVNAALQLKHFDLVGERLLVGLQHADHVLAVFFFADEQAALYVLRFAARLDHVAVGIFLHKLDRRIERVEFLVRNNVDAGFFQLFLAEGAIVFQPVGVFACRR